MGKEREEGEEEEEERRGERRKRSERWPPQSEFGYYTFGTHTKKGGIHFEKIIKNINL